MPFAAAHAAELAALTTGPANLDLLRGLVGAGYLNLQAGAYVIGAETYALAVKVGASIRLPQLTHAILQRLSEQTHETALMGAPTNDDQITYVDKVEANRVIRAHVDLGERRALYSSAGGRAILAFLPPDKIAAYLAQTRLEPETPHTQTDRRRLLGILAEIRERGFAVTVGEAEAGLSGIAAPVFDNQAQVVGCLILSGPSDRLEPHLAPWAELVRAAARELSRLRGFAG